MRIAKTYINMPVYVGHALEKNKEYVMSGAVMQQLIKIYPGGIFESGKFENYYNKLNVGKFPPVKGSKIFMFRSGGIGDVMFMLPLIHFLKEEFECSIKVATSPKYVSILYNHPDIDEVFKMPFPLEIMEWADYHLMFEGLIENANEDAEKLHSVDLFLKEAGIDYASISGEFKVPRIYISEAEKKMSKLFLEKSYLNKNFPNIGFQIQASSPIRTFPLDKMIFTIRHLVKEGYNIFIFGGKGQQEIGEHIIESMKGEVFEGTVTNLASENISIKESIVLASFMNLIVAPDSAFIHIAGALGIPVVGLYGCFPSFIRMRYYKNAIGIDCNVACAPSFIHGHLPCYKGNPSPCFSVISVENVLHAIYHLLGKFDLTLEYPTYNVFKDGDLKENFIF